MHQKTPPVCSRALKPGILSPCGGNAGPPGSTGGEIGGSLISAAGASGCDPLFPPPHPRGEYRETLLDCPTRPCWKPLLMSPYCSGEKARVGQGHRVPCISAASSQATSSLGSRPCCLGAFAPAVSTYRNVSLCASSVCLLAQPSAETSLLREDWPGPWTPGVWSLFYILSQWTSLPLYFHIINYACKVHKQFTLVVL